MISADPVKVGGDNALLACILTGTIGGINAIGDDRMQCNAGKT
jgi:hypothetical protein